MSERPLLVIKLGSNALVGPDGHLDGDFLTAIAAQLVAVRAAGWTPVVVSSGAVACGMAALGLAKKPDGMPERQALAAIGQAGLMQQWAAACARHGLQVGQILLTNDDFHHRERYLNLKAAFDACRDYGIVPVVNENDTVSVAELTVGDNDRLSAMVAAQLGARLLLLLTDIDGYYSADPRTDPTAQLLAEIPAITPAILAAAGGGGRLGRGGMRSKMEAARLAASAGVTTVIAKARTPAVITRLAAGEAVGTRVPGADGGRPDGRRRWLALARKPRGQVVVDDGAANALRRQGRSLLPAGITAVSGDFARGDTVAVVDSRGDEIARGLASLSAEELGQITGQRLDAATRRLGYALPKAAIHRDNLIVV
jgi:glutamate 5-kinase